MSVSTRPDVNMLEQSIQIMTSVCCWVAVLEEGGFGAKKAVHKVA